MELVVQHQTRYRYDPEAGMAALRLKLFPSDSAGQRTGAWSLTVNGEDVIPLLTDAHGDLVALWHHHGAISEIEIEATGAIVTSDTAGVLRDLPQAARPGIFLRTTDLTLPDDAIRDLADQSSGDTLLARMHDLSRLTGEAIAYRKGATDAETTAAQAMVRGAGVCQDQAHVFISAARTLRVPARYVIGYLFDPEGETAPNETHAWAEVYIQGLGWTGFDVTNEICPTEAYVRLCCGFDAGDAAPVRGTVLGTPDEEMEVAVKVSAAGQAQQ